MIKTIKAVIHAEICCISKGKHDIMLYSRHTKTLVSDTVVDLAVDLRHDVGIPEQKIVITTNLKLRNKRKTIYCQVLNAHIMISMSLIGILFACILTQSCHYLG